jgi:transcriptional regulator with XRE-family HTH domain
MDRKSFGVWLKEQRVAKNLIQDDLAKQIKMFRTELAAIENGTNHFPTHKISALSKALGVDREKIFQMTLKVKEGELRKKMDEG